MQNKMALGDAFKSSWKIFYQTHQHEQIERRYRYSEF